jgi:hypothetical protein
MVKRSMANALQAAVSRAAYQIDFRGSAVFSDHDFRGRVMILKFILQLMPRGAPRPAWVVTRGFSLVCST